MRQQDPVLVDIVDLHDDGYGRASENKLFVFGALPGERVLAQPFTRRHKKIFARTLSVELASMDRVTPVCHAADICGGCSLQHLHPDRQIEAKQKGLLALLGDLQPAQILPPLTGPRTNYRHKARLGVKYVNKKDKVLVGFREKMSPYVAEIDRCEILAPPVGELLPALSELVGSLTTRASVPQIEVAVGEDRAAFIFRHLQPFSEEDLVLLRQFADKHKVDIYLQPKGPDSVWRLTPCEGDDRLHYGLPAYDLEFAFHPQDFTQINMAINRLLVAQALQLLDLCDQDIVLDLFCGIGNFTLAMGRSAASVTGVESVVSAVDRARENARRNDIANCNFVVGDLFTEHWDLPGGDSGDSSLANKVLLDPPRSGALEVCKRLASHKVERVVYVSCNPVTLARDARVLVESGYRMDKAGVVDMFPHTTHVESIACFSY